MKKGNGAHEGNFLHPLLYLVNVAREHVVMAVRGKRPLGSSPWSTADHVTKSP